MDLDAELLQLLPEWGRSNAVDNHREFDVTTIEPANCKVYQFNEAQVGRVERLRSMAWTRENRRAAGRDSNHVLVDFASVNDEEREATGNQDAKVWFLARVRCFYILQLAEPVQRNGEDVSLFRVALLDRVYGCSPGLDRGTGPHPDGRDPGLVKVECINYDEDIGIKPMLYDLDSIKEKVCIAIPTSADENSYVYYMRYHKSYRLAESAPY